MRVATCMSLFSWLQLAALFVLQATKAGVEAWPKLKQCVRVYMNLENTLECIPVCFMVVSAQ